MKKLILIGTAFILCSGFGLAKINATGMFPTGFSEISVTSPGIGRKGNVTVGDYSGTYERSAGSNSHGFVGMNRERNSATVDLALNNTKTGQTIGGNCDTKQKSVGGSMIRIETAAWSMSCDYSGSTGVLPIKLQMAENPNYTMRAGNLREGTAEYNGQIYQISSIHQMANQRRSIGPIGYSFSINGRTIGAIEKTGTNKLYIANGISDAEKDLSYLLGAAFLLLWESPS